MTAISLPASAATRRRRAASLVAARLDELDRPADLIREDGLESLYRRSRGSEDRLRALLASALFIASTEDSDHVGEDHVSRAAAMLDEGETSPRPLTRPWLPAAAILAILLLAFAGLNIARRSQALVAQAPPPIETIASTVITAAPATAAPLTLAATAPTQTVDAVAVEPAAPEIALPAAPPTTVLIRYRANDPDAAAAAKAVTQRLQAIGITPSLGQTHGRSPASVGYFYQEDKDSAVRIATATAAAGPVMPPPRLIKQAEATSLLPPGSIQINIP